MHCLNAFRTRTIIIILVMFIFWQIFRNWPGEDDYSVSWSKFRWNWREFNEFSNFFKCIEFSSWGWIAGVGDGILWSFVSRFKAFYSQAITTIVRKSTNASRFPTGSLWKSNGTYLLFRILCLFNHIHSFK